MRNNDNQKLKLDSILKKLPMLRFLDDSKSYILSIQPVWERWKKRSLNHSDSASAHLAAFRAGELLIHVSDSSIAALIKSQNQSLLKTLNSASSTNIHKIKVKIDLQSTSIANKVQKEGFAKPTRTYQTSPKPNHLAVSSIEKLQSSVKNQDLADSLKDLATTLKNISD